MKLKISYLILFTLLVNIFSANATVRYVSKTGTSTPPYTSWESSADSIQKCINICNDGDTIYVANGVYKENLVINAAISLIGSSMDSTVIDGTGLTVITVELVPHGIGGTIENFRILGKGFNQGACILSEKDIIIRNCNLENGIVGIRISNAASIVENIVIKNCAQGVYGGCESLNCYNYLGNSLILIEAQNSNAITLSSGINYLINNTVLFLGNNSNGGIGVYINLAPSVHISNNIISEFGTDIFVEAPSDTIFIKNNILINRNDTGILTSGGGWVVVNNVVFNKNKIGIRGNWRVDSDYNMFWESQTNLVGVTMGDSDIVANPMFVNDTIPTSKGDYDFHLQSFSPAIDKGNPNILDLDGTKSDIGLYGGPFGETYTYQDLAPLAPRNLSAVVDTNTILISWNRNTEADNSFYKVYRDTVSGFTIDSTKLVSSSADSFYVQPNPHINTRLVYKVTCIDNQGNESLPSNELVVNITSVSTDDYPMTISDYVLYQNYPNPFNPSTKIGYQIKERAYVKLMVYDIKGELVSVLVNKEQNAGYYEVDFSVNSLQSSVGNSIASGIYLYRIEVIGAGSIPVYTEMKKMLLIK